MIRTTWEALAGAVAFAAGLIGATSAHAADLGGYGRGSTKDAAYATERPVIGNWSGIYLGVNAGGVWDSYASDYRQFADLYVNPDSPKYSSDSSHVLLGGHVGIQHQFGRIVAGIEASWSGSPFDNDFHGVACFAGAGGSHYACQARMNSYVTVGPRLGITHDNLLFYVTGGYASAQIQSREYDPYRVAGLGTENWRWAERHNGWFLGGGVEMMLRDRWMLGIEYVHIDLDSERHSLPVVSAQTRQIDGDADIVRVRLSYKFGRGDGGYTNQPLK